MRRKKVFFIALAFALLIIVSGLQVNDDHKAIAKDSSGMGVRAAENKGNANQKPAKTENISKPFGINLWREDFTLVSIIQLISNPDKFDGKRVLLIGFVHVAFEGDAIYLHEDDFKYGLTKNGLWLNLTEDIYGKDRQKFDQKYVLVEGTFSARDYGHMGLYNGAIKDIKRFEPWNFKR